MSRAVPVGDYVEHFDPDIPHHRAWLLAVLEQLVAHDPQALEEGGTLRRLWSARQAPAAEGGSAPLADIPAAVAVALPLVKEFEGCRLTAYPDPETGGAPWTIGWGSTWDSQGRPFREGDRISQEQAVGAAFSEGVALLRSRLVPTAMPRAMAGRWWWTASAERSVQRSGRGRRRIGCTTGLSAVGICSCWSAQWAARAASRLARSP
jgi:hypothetical protein